MEQKFEELKRSIEDRFDKQKDSLREIISEICSALFDKFKKDLKEEMKKEIDEQITKINNQILELKQANVKLQNELAELEQYGRRSCIRIDGIPEVSNESSEDVFNNIVDMFVRVGIEDIEQNIDRAHRIGKSYHHKKSKKNCKSIIVKFSSFRYRTKAYRQIKIYKNFRKDRNNTQLLRKLEHLQNHLNNSIDSSKHNYYLRMANKLNIFKKVLKHTGLF